MTRLIVVGPVPPPIHGVAVSTELVLASESLARHFQVEHLDTSDRRAGTTLGRWDLRNVQLGFLHALRLARRCGGPRGIVYLPLSQGAGGFMRDSLLIHVAALRGWTVVAHLRGSEFGRFLRTSPRLLRWWARLALARVDSVAVMGDSLRGILAGLVPNERIAVVPNGTPDNGVAHGPADRGHVLFLSHLRRRKGVLEALDAALLVLQRVPDARFVFAGEWEDPQLEASARRAAAAADGGVEFVHARDAATKAALLADASLLLFPPTDPEGHPRVVLEAIAAGLPVVTTDRGAIAETVVDGESGFVLADPCVDDLAQCVTALLEDDALRLRMAAAARERYLDRFTPAHADAALVRWLQELER